MILFLDVSNLHDVVRVLPRLLLENGSAGNLNLTPLLKVLFRFAFFHLIHLAPQAALWADRMKTKAFRRRVEDYPVIRLGLNKLGGAGIKLMSN